MIKAEYEYIYDMLKNLILNKPVEASLAKDADGDLLELEEGMVYLSKCIQEMNRATIEMASGNLDLTFPKEHNLLLGNLKELSSVMRHITWQATQVANGDYSQKVANLGEFSDSFNIMISQLKERELKLTQIAYLDALSDVYNRRYCMNMLDVYHQQKASFCLIMIDLNGLKVVNDTLGHAGGDYYICTVVSVLKAAVRGDDVICRIGGDEFVLLLKDCDEVNAEKKMIEVNRRLAEQSEEGLYSVSYGIVRIEVESDWEIDRVLQESDEKMYACKQEMKRRK